MIPTLLSDSLVPNTFTVETAGGEAIRVDAGRRLLVGTDSSKTGFGIFQINGTTSSDGT